MFTDNEYFSEGLAAVATGDYDDTDDDPDNWTCTNWGFINTKLRLLGRMKTVEQVEELRQVISNYYAQKATDEMDKLWDNGQSKRLRF